MVQGLKHSEKGPSIRVLVQVWELMGPPVLGLGGMLVLSVLMGLFASLIVFLCELLVLPGGLNL